MYLQVGRAIVTLSEIKEYLAEMFVLLSKPMSEAQAAKMFYEVQNIAHKIKLLDYAVMRSSWKDGHAKWAKLSARISKQKFVRNVAAHASLEFKQDKENKGWRISLGTQARDNEHRKTDFEIQDVKAAADELVDIHSSIRKLLMQFAKHN